MTRFAGERMQRAMSQGGTKGSFKAAASRADMGVQEFANHVLANKQDFTPAMRRKANFARNASRWNKG